MTQFEYRVVPAPKRSEKGKAKASDERFAQTLEALMNEMGLQGWEYLRADTLPSEERQGLTGRATIYHNVLVFRRTRGLPAMPSAEPPLTAATLAAPADSAR